MPREVFGQVCVSGSFVEFGESASGLSVACVDSQLQGLLRSFVVAGGTKKAAEFSLRPCVACIRSELVKVLLSRCVAVLTAPFGQLPQGDGVAFGRCMKCQPFRFARVTGIIPRRDEPSQTSVASQAVQAPSLGLVADTLLHESHVEQRCSFSCMAQVFDEPLPNIRRDAFAKKGEEEGG
ncbi:hypothetical protein [Streptomyces griseoruber]|uniref:hypothetical protein n=1 Tax=Streptomyces griseoruber TaxID=1943 RepID=UPI0012FEDCF2|nr:hypothetical protein [Streptomyces griseoruber]